MEEMIKMSACHMEEVEEVSVMEEILQVSAMEKMVGERVVTYLHHLDHQCHQLHLSIYKVHS